MDSTSFDRSLPLAVRHRPRRFAEVVGQRPVCSALAAAVASNSVPQQLLLSGGSGLGKTTIARIFAAALLCENPNDNGDCCGQCGSCRDIAEPSRSHPDVIEMDAASNGGKDEIARIAERVPLAPMRGGRKVYIVDEAHGITRLGSEAFLKLLEEPPTHVCFVLATTDPDKVLHTLRGRCVELGFAPPSRNEMVEHVLSVAEAEGWDVSDEVACTVVDSAGENLGVRGALTSLGRLAPLYASGKNPTSDDVYDVLGAPAPAALEALAEAVFDGDPHRVFALAGPLQSRFGDAPLRYGLTRIVREKLKTGLDTAAVARRLECLATAPPGPVGFEVALARATVAGFDGPVGLSELVASANAAADRLDAALQVTSPRPSPQSTPSGQGEAHVEPVPSGPVDQGNPSTAESTSSGHERHSTTPDNHLTNIHSTNTDSGLDHQGAFEPGDPGPTEPPEETWGPPPGEPHEQVYPPEDTSSHITNTSLTDDGWFDNPDASTTEPRTGGPVPPRRTGGPAPRKNRATTKKTPAKKPLTKKTPAKKPPTKKAQQPPPTQPAPQPASRLSQLKDHLDPTASRLLARMSCSQSGSDLVIVVPRELVEGMRAREDIRQAIIQGARTAGFTNVRWKAAR